MWGNGYDSSKNSHNTTISNTTIILPPPSITLEKFKLHNDNNNDNINNYNSNDNNNNHLSTFGIEEDSTQHYHQQKHDTTMKMEELPCPFICVNDTSTINEKEGGKERKEKEESIISLSPLMIKNNFTTSTTSSSSSLTTQTLPSITSTSSIISQTLPSITSTSSSSSSSSSSIIPTLLHDKKEENEKGGEILSTSSGEEISDGIHYTLDQAKLLFHSILDSFTRNNNIQDLDEFFNFVNENFSNIKKNKTSSIKEEEMVMSKHNNKKNKNIVEKMILHQESIIKKKSSISTNERVMSITPTKQKKMNKKKKKNIRKKKKQNNNNRKYDSEYIIYEMLNATYSELGTIDLTKIINYSVFSALDAHEKNSLLQYMSPADIESDNNVQKALARNIISPAVQMYQRLLIAGEFDDQHSQDIKSYQRGIKKRQIKQNSWKAKHFEEYWGQQLKRMEQRIDKLDYNPNSVILSFKYNQCDTTPMWPVLEGEEEEEEEKYNKEEEEEEHEEEEEEEEEEEGEGNKNLDEYFKDDDDEELSEGNGGGSKGGKEYILNNKDDDDYDDIFKIEDWMIRYGVNEFNTGNSRRPTTRSQARSNFSSTTLIQENLNQKKDNIHRSTISDISKKNNNNKKKKTNKKKKRGRPISTGNNKNIKKKSSKKKKKSHIMHITDEIEVRKERENTLKEKTKKKKSSGASFRQGAYSILKREGMPLKAKEIVSIALAEGLFYTTGKTPQNTLASLLYCDIKDNPSTLFVKVLPMTFGLVEDMDTYDMNEVTKRIASL